MRYIWILLLLPLLLAACEAQQLACTPETMQCPDGTFVGRTGPNCEFEECADSDIPISVVHHPGEEKMYVSDDPDRCAAIRFTCEDNEEAFFDETGCGCQSTQASNEKIYCEPNQRNVDVCGEIYQKVCGWYDPQEVNCFAYPCAIEFSNSCFACDDQQILYYTLGSCPHN